jgi:hypothetical protein
MHCYATVLFVRTRLGFLRRAGRGVGRRREGVHVAA